MILSNAEADYDLFMAEPEAYRIVSEFEDQWWDKKFREYMGPEFSEEPLPTEEELQEAISTYQDSLENLYKTNAPEFAIGVKQDVLGELINQHKNNRYIVTAAEAKYREDYAAKANKFYETYDKV